MKFISLFCGMGGFDLALERLGHESVYANDIDKYCKIVYDRHFRTKLDLRDIRTVTADQLPDFSLLCGGFPCQSFSIAGKRKGFDDTRGTLFFQIARIVKTKRPAYLFLENVKGLLSHDNGRTFEVILRTLDELGYGLQWQVCNSKNFGVPQNRERVFIIGHLRGQPRPEVFPIGATSQADIVLPTLTTRYFQAQANGGYLRQISPKGTSQGQRVYDPSGISVTLAGQGGGLGAKTGLYFANERVRRLTPRECELLQGFPSDWTRAEGVSDTQRYKMCGNAVTVNTVYEIAKRAFANSAENI